LIYTAAADGAAAAVPTGMQQWQQRAQQQLLVGAHTLQRRE